MLCESFKVNFVEILCVVLLRILHQLGPLVVHQFDGEGEEGKNFLTTMESGSATFL